jgi:hypothetical protein
MSFLCSIVPLLDRFCRIPERWLRRVAQYRALSIGLIGLLAFTGSAVVAWRIHIPEPAVHDEFSYLLAADTFAHGRLTNPTHPMWAHFESMHIIQRPTYASKYPPAQGLMLAIGQVLGGHPVVGVWLSAGLACAAIYWMLLGWVPPAWALLGGFIVVTRIGVPSYWSHSYWGGWVAALGGSLVFGAVRRIVRRPRARDSLLMGIGLAVLANSRPYEGLVASLPALALLGASILGSRVSRARGALQRTLLPMAIVLACAAGAMAIYNWRVTGSPVYMPYQLHEATYAAAPTFVWQQPRHMPVYRHQAMQDFQLGELELYTTERSIRGFLWATGGKARELFGFYLGRVLALPLLALPWVLKSRWMRFALLAGIVFGAALLAETHWFAHYAAPVTGLVFLLLVQSLRHLRLVRWRSIPVGRVLIWAFPLACVYHMLTSYAPIRWSEPSWALRRGQLQSRLQQDGNQHLVIVRYSARHNPNYEWVYNGADIDRASVVWAREMDAGNNRELLRYFAGRRAWLLEADTDDPSLVPYPWID